MNTIRPSFSGIVAAAALAFAAPSLAAQTTSTATLDMTATIVAATPTCSATVPTVDWGTFEQGVQSPSVSFDLGFDCSAPVTNATFSFDGGQSPTGSTGAYQRRMSQGPHMFQYVMSDASTSQHLAVDQAVTLALPSGPSTRTILAGAGGPWNGALGTYTDQLTVTFSF